MYLPKIKNESRTFPGIPSGIWKQWDFREFPGIPVREFPVALVLNCEIFLHLELFRKEMF